MDIISKTITNQDSSLFRQFWKIYCYSFPDIEKRPLRNQIRIFNKDNYTLKVFLINDKFLGFASYWEFERYCYIEHFAVSRQYRGSGYGKQILNDFIKLTNHQIILEIDPLNDEISKRRFQFYKSLGFKYNSFDHFHPAYRERDKPYELLVLSYPTLISQKVYDTFIFDLENEIVAK